MAALLICGDLVALLTRASKGALQVDAPSMGTDPRGQTLIHIYTAPALAPVTLLTGQTSVGSGGVDAFPIRAGARVTAFINILAVSLPDHDVALVTSAVVGALCVGAPPLVARLWLLTLVYVLAFWRGPGGGWRVARVAEAGVGAHAVDTAPSSCAGIPQTLVVIHAVGLAGVQPVAGVADASVSISEAHTGSGATDVIGPRGTSVNIWGTQGHQHIGGGGHLLCVLGLCNPLSR